MFTCIGKKQATLLKKPWKWCQVHINKLPHTGHYPIIWRGLILKTKQDGQNEVAIYKKKEYRNQPTTTKTITRQLFLLENKNNL